MKNIFYGLVFITGLFSASCVVARPVLAQTAPPAQAAMPQTAAEKDPFADDPRLQQIIDYRCEQKGLGLILRDLSERCKFSYRLSPAPEDDAIPITLHFTRQPLKNVLASLPPFCAGKAKWSRDGKTLLLLLPGEDNLDDDRPHTQAEADTQAQGRAFLDAAARLAPDLQKRLRQDAAKNLRYEEMPPDAQQILRDLLAAKAQQMREEKSAESNIKSALRDDLTGCEIAIAPATNANEAIQSCDIQLSFNGATGGSNYIPISINRFVDPKEDYHVTSILSFEQQKAAVEAEKARIYKDCLASQEEALAQDARLMRRVSLTLDRVTLTQAIQNVARLADIPTAADYLSVTETHSFQFQNVPLKDVLAQVLAAYKHHTVPQDWAMRDADGNKTGMVERNGDTVAFRDTKGRIVTTMQSPKPRGYTTQYVWGWQKTGVFLFREHSEYDSQPIAAAPVKKP